MRRLLAPIAAALVLVTTSCVGGGGDERLLLVDYSSDRYGSFFLYNFPKKVAVHPGTTLVFRQTWTGEPHTVTTGTAVQAVLDSTKSWLDLFVPYETLQGSNPNLVDPENPGDATVADFINELKKARPRSEVNKILIAWEALRTQGVKLPDSGNPPDTSFEELSKYIDEASNKAFEDLPFAFGEEEDQLVQGVAQPCYLKTGRPPKDRACRSAQQGQTAFDGTQSFYNSGIIRYEGQTGNTFRLPLADDIRPGKYDFYCAVHGPLQGTEVEVKPASEDIPSQEDVTRDARREIESVSKPLNEVWSDAQDGRIKIGEGDAAETVNAPFAGLFSPKEIHSAIDAFVPERITVKAGEPIAWKMMGAEHTISFDVPRYFPPVEFLKDGTVRLNPKLHPPAGGAPKPPEGDNPPTKIDGGTYDGTGFWSSGLIGACPECGGPSFIEYTLRISKPGTYKYACLLHPPMVGTVVVS
jgi:plastocyanin